MSVLNGYGKYKRYVKKDTGYQLCSHWTSSNTVHFDDGNTAQTKLGAINGITDSLTATSSNVALSSKAGNSLQNQINTLNTGIGITEVYKAGLSVALGSSAAYISNAFDTRHDVTDFLKPVSTGILVLRPCLCLVHAQFAISTNTAGYRLSYGVRHYMSATSYSDSVNSVASASTLSSTYHYFRMLYVDKNDYIRPIAMAPNGGTCTGCTMTVASLKAA